MPKTSGAKMTTTKLSIQQEEFVFQLMSDPNFSAKNAARKAGYKNPGPMASQLMCNPKVQKAIAKLRKEAAERTEITVDEIRRQLFTVIKRDVRKLVYQEGKNKGEPIPVEDLPDDIVAAIDGYEEQRKVVYNSEGEEVGCDIKRKYKLSSITPNLDLMMKHLGMFEAQQVDVTHRFDFDGLFGDPVDVMGDDIEERIEGAVVKVLNPNETKKGKVK